MRKKFSPVLISNPVSDNHLVRVRPNQSFILRLSDDMGITEIDSDSHFFELAETKRQDQYQLFLFRQTADFFDWSLLSSVHLGDVVLLKQDYSIINLCVILESTNHLKKDVISCINPEGWHIKVKPDQIIELILFDEMCKGEWNCEIHEGADKKIRFEQICSQVIERDTEPLIIDEYDKRINDVFFPFPRSRSARVTEQHFWFRCDHETITKLYSLEDGTFHAGSIVATPATGIHMLKTLNISLGIKAKRKDTLYKARLLPAARDGDSKLPVVSYRPRYNFYPRVDGTYKHSDKSWKNRDNYAHNYAHNYIPRTEIQEIEIKEKKFGSLEDGCKIETLKSIAKNRNKTQVPNEYQGIYCE
jgi:hypothetical protein